MNKFLRSFKTTNYKPPKVSNFSFSTKNFNENKSKLINTYLESITEQINVEKDKQVNTLYEKIEEDNYQLSKKITSILQTQATEEMKTISVLNEINRFNINNTEQLLSIHQNYLFSFNYKMIQMILNSYERILRIFSPITILSVLGIYFGYQYIKKNYLVGRKLETKDVIKFYRENPDKLFKAESILPAFYDHKNITNLISNGKLFMLIGPKGIGKTYSVKNFCLIEGQKDSIVLYKDLNLVEKIDNIYEFICSNTIEFYKNQKKVEVDLNYNEILEEIKERKVFFIFDHFMNNPKLFNSIKKVIDVLKSYNVNIILISDNNKYTEFALEENFDIKSVDEKIVEKFNNYLLENANHLMKSSIKYSNCELFSEENIKELRKNYHFTFSSILEYLNSNTSMKNFSNEQNNKILQKLRFLFSKNPEIVHTLKEALKLQKKPQEWIKINDTKHYNHLLILEKNDLIAIRNIDEIRILNPITGELLNKI